MFDDLILAVRSLRPGLRKIAGNTGWLILDRVIRLGVGFFVLAWIARYLGPERFGLLSYALAFVALFSAVATMGLNAIVVRNLVLDTANKYELLGTVFVLRLFGGIAAFLLAVGAVRLLYPNDALTRWLVAVVAAGVVFEAFDAIDLWFQSHSKAKYTVYAKNVAFLLVAVSSIVLVQLEAPLLAFAWASLAEVALGATALAVAYRIDRQRIGAWRINLERGKALLLESWPLILSGLAVVVYMRIDQVMLREMAGAEAVGVYSVATRISEVWYFIPTAVATSVFPFIVRARETDEHLYYRRLQRLFGFLTGAALAIAVPMTFLSGALVKLMFGNDYAAAGPILAIHIWAAVFVFLGVAQTAWFVNEGLIRLSFLRTASGMVINIVLNLLLIPLYSGVGAAVATVVAYAFAGVFANLLNRRTRPIFYLQVTALTSVKDLFSRD